MNEAVVWKMTPVNIRGRVNFQTSHLGPPGPPGAQSLGYCRSHCDVRVPVLPYTGSRSGVPALGMPSWYSESSHLKPQRKFSLPSSQGV